METTPNNHDKADIGQDSAPEQRRGTPNQPERDVPDLPNSDDETQRLLDPVKTQKGDQAA